MSTTKKKPLIIKMGREAPIAVRGSRVTVAVRLAVFAAVVVAVWVSREAKASHPLEHAAVVSCGKLESFQGGVQVFDTTRTTAIDVKPNQTLQCGDWISVSQGKAVIRHNLGFQVTLGAGSFLQILDPQSGDNPEKDHFALYRGQAIFKSGERAPEMKVATANARGRFHNSEGYFLYSYDFHVSQLVGIDGVSKLENRFLDARPIDVARSQVSSMGELDHRVVPRLARTVSMASVKERLVRLGVTTDIQKQMVDQMKVLAETRMTARLSSDRPEKKTAVQSAEHGRSPASFEEAHPPSASSLTQFELSRPKPEAATEPAHRVQYPLREVSSVKHAVKRPAVKKAKKSAHEVYSAHEDDSRPSSEVMEKRELLRQLSQIEPE